MTFMIENNVALPTGRTGRPSKWRELIAQVNHGDSILLSESERNSLQGSMCRTNKDSGFRIVSRKVEESVDGGDSIFRVWFVDKSADDS